MKTLFNLIVMVTLVTMPAFAQGEWTIIPNPDTQMYDLYSIAVTPNGTVHAVGENGTYIRDTGSGFENQPEPANNPYDIEVIVFVNDDVGYLGGENETISKTTDGGENWIEQRGVFGGATIHDFDFRSADSGIAVGCDGSIFKTVDGGANWTQQGQGLTTHELYSVDHTDNGIIMICGKYSTILRSIDWGNTWAVIQTGDPVFAQTVNMITNEVGFIAIQLANYILHTIDGGQTWNQVGGPVSGGVSGLTTFSENELYLYAASNLYYSWNAGINWETSSLPTSDPIMDLLILEDKSAWIVGFNGLIAHNPAIPLSIELINNQVPHGYILMQNYPNPFNPTTTISYQLPKSAFVNLYIYNIAGQLVETLVNEKKNVGYHSVIWNASGVGSGLYFYQIEAGLYSETKKCLILK